MVLIKDLIGELSKVEQENIGVCSLDNITMPDGTIIMFLLGNSYEELRDKYLK